MVVRLILVMLLALVSTPAPASACHAPVPAMAGTHHGDDDHAPLAEQVAPEHACVGCVPPAAPARVAPHAFRVSASQPASPVVRLDLRGAAAPVTPPPRG